MGTRTFLQLKIQKYSTDHPQTWNRILSTISDGDDPGFKAFMTDFAYVHPNAFIPSNEFSSVGEPDPQLFLDFIGRSADLGTIQADVTAAQAAANSALTLATTANTAATAASTAAATAQTAADSANSKIGDLSTIPPYANLTSAVKNAQETIDFVDNKVGLLINLATTDKTEIVRAVNEVKTDALSAQAVANSANSTATAASTAAATAQTAADSANSKIGDLSTIPPFLNLASAISNAQAAANSADNNADNARIIGITGRGAAWFTCLIGDNEANDLQTIMSGIKSTYVVGVSTGNVRKDCGIALGKLMQNFKDHNGAHALDVLSGAYPGSPTQDHYFSNDLQCRNYIYSKASANTIGSGSITGLCIELGFDICNQLL